MLAKRLIKTCAIALLGTVVAGTAQAGSVENMERERAIMLEAMLNPDLSPQERQGQITTAKRRLVDLERIVLRDKELVGRDTPAVKRAFANYDLTFLVHASGESKLLIMDHWMDQLGVSTQDVMTAVQRRR